jgi:hypothetical protein
MFMTMAEMVVLYRMERVLSLCDDFRYEPL